MRPAHHERLIQTWAAATGSPSGKAPSEARLGKLEQLRRLAFLRLSGKIDEVMAGFSDDCELYVVGGPQFSPISGRFQGRAQILRQMGLVNRLLDFVDLEFISVIIENDDVAIRWTCRARSPSPRAESVEGMSIVHFDDGLISYYGHFLDMGALARLADWDEIVALSRED
jgi:ketosteroid isomerase-like protein